MKKKNLVAMGLAGVMLVGGCVPVLAAGIEPTSGTDGTPNSASQKTTIDITEAIEYSLNIPATFDTDTKSISISVDEGIKLEPNKIVTVSAASEVELKNNVDANAAKIWNMNLKYNNDDFSSITFSTDDPNTKTISLVDGTNNNKKYAGKYSGEVTFSIAYTDAATN